VAELEAARATSHHAEATSAVRSMVEVEL
jgi:hypothetical protein